VARILTVATNLFFLHTFQTGYGSNQVLIQWSSEEIRVGEGGHLSQYRPRTDVAKGAKGRIKLYLHLLSMYALLPNSLSITVSRANVLFVSVITLRAT
jgi:hypothetical protein